MAEPKLSEIESIHLSLEDESDPHSKGQGGANLPKGPTHVYVLGELVPFPGVVFPLVLEDDQECLLFDTVHASGDYVGFFNQDVLARETGPQFGVLAKLLKIFRLPDGRTSVVVQCITRAVFKRRVKTKPFLTALLEYPRDTYEHQNSIEALRRQLKLKLEEYIKGQPQIPEEIQLAAVNIDEPARLADFVAQNFIREKSERLEILEQTSIHMRLMLTLEKLIRELELLKVGNKISDDIQKKLETTQRQFYLREQIKAIRKELGEDTENRSADIEEFEKKLAQIELPEVVRNRVDSELRRLRIVPLESPEHGLIRHYLESIADLPWNKTTEDIHDLSFAQKVMHEDHFGLDEIKQRILEFLAVRQLNPKTKGGIICFVGPPGVGKTSLGRSIARALGRQFYRFSVGGMRDEAEIKGHRRTYVGAMPGRILQGLRFLGVKNPVFMLDEIDKMGRDFRGDPASAMLEVLDPEQNTSFLDHYLDLPFDLSQVLFVCTANVKTDIPLPLLDRMELVELSGYIPEEKLQIAERYLVPKQLKEHGLQNKKIKFQKRVLDELIESYTREAGVRDLDRQIAKVCRKIATFVVQNIKSKTAIKPLTLEQLAQYLGPCKYDRDTYQKRPPCGVALGLAWTPVGGDVLFIETKKMKGTGKVILTGQIGSVMNESAQIAMSLLRERQSLLSLPDKFFTENDIHIHFPSGSVPKDGPSAGVTIFSALISLLSERLIHARLAMTGEITLRGEVLPVGGIREKIVAARRAGIKTIILPEKNLKDLEEVPDYIKDKLNFLPVSSVSELLVAAMSE